MKKYGYCCLTLYHIYHITVIMLPIVVGVLTIVLYENTTKPKFRCTKHINDIYTITINKRLLPGRIAVLYTNFDNVKSPNVGIQKDVTNQHQLVKIIEIPSYFSTEPTPSILQFYDKSTIAPELFSKACLQANASIRIEHGEKEYELDLPSIGKFPNNSRREYIKFREL